MRTFRKDINGLRALAVIAVVLFHFDPQWLPGGFAGVDVFFVISGFLMTSIIYRKLEKQDLSLMDFYQARGRRIIPALAVVCFILLVFGWFYLNPIDYRTLGKHVASSISFLSNVMYWSEAGYFNSASHEKWLLHTWSLSVEWQFYILYPVLMLVIAKIFTLQKMRQVLLILTLLFFLLSFYVSLNTPETAFYLLHTRAWEMMVGGLAFLFPLKLNTLKQKILARFGVVLIILSYVSMSNNDLWPGYLALMPVLGTFFVIVAARDNSLLLNNILSQWFGKISYSLYLWHWSIFVLMNYLDIDNSFFNVAIAILLSIALGYLSYSFIETKFGKKPKSVAVVKSFKRNSFIFFRSIPVMLIIIFGLLGSTIYMGKGFPYRVSEKVQIASDEARNRNPNHCISNLTDAPNNVGCFIGNKKNVGIIVIGDSHADALTTSVAAAISKNNNKSLLAITRSGCPSIIGTKMRYFNQNEDNCAESVKQTLKLIDDDYQGIPVVVINRMSVYIHGQSDPSRTTYGQTPPLIYFTEQFSEINDKFLDDFSVHYKKTMCSIAARRTLFITLPVPEMGMSVPSVISKNLLLGNNDKVFSRNKALYYKRNEFVLTLMEEVREECNAILLDPTEYLCMNDHCISNIKGRPLYFDGDHLSEYGNKLLVPMFESMWLADTN
jgi:peptidoglycan/LPS O-acetylase OafA/YrhL